MSVTRGHEPERQCVSCRKMFKKSDLIRVVRMKDGTVQVDREGTMQGRGAYVCRSSECLEKAVRKGALARTLRGAVPQQVADEIARGMR